MPDAFFRLGTALFLLAETQNVVGRDVVEVRQIDEVSDGHFAGSALIPGIHGLGSSNELCYLLLGQVVVFSEITHDSLIVSHDTYLLPLFSFQVPKQILPNYGRHTEHDDPPGTEVFRLV